MKVLVLGATGLLGQALMATLKDRQHNAIGAARSGTDLIVDVSKKADLFRVLCRVDADIIINAAACVDIAACEDNPYMAYSVNGAPAGVLAAWADQTGGRFIQVSTDHYFNSAGPKKHDEKTLVAPPNGYAASKLAGEVMALEGPNSLILRTNICGAQKGFGRWVIDSLQNQTPLRLFTDYYTSTMHVSHCAEAIVDLMATKETGILNLASSDVTSKADFVAAVASAMEIDLDWAVLTTAGEMTPKRALSCGLDVTRIEGILGRAMPTLQDTVEALILEDNPCAMIPASRLAIA